MVGIAPVASASTAVVAGEQLPCFTQPLSTLPPRVPAPQLFTYYPPACSL